MIPKRVASRLDGNLVADVKKYARQSHNLGEPVSWRQSQNKHMKLDHLDEGHDLHRYGQKSTTWAEKTAHQGEIPTHNLKKDSGGQNSRKNDNIGNIVKKSSMQQQSRHASTVTEKSADDPFAEPRLTLAEIQCDKADGPKKDCHGLLSGIRGKRSRFRRGYTPVKSEHSQHIAYIVDQPHRVALRLEKLMGHATVYLNDANYFKQLNKAIRRDEEKLHQEISKARQDGERARIRDLVLDGLMEPPDDMPEIKASTIYRVNKMFEKISKMDTFPGSYNQRQCQLPKIRPLEPFQDSPSGKYFEKLHQQLNLTLPPNKRMKYMRTSGHILIPSASEKSIQQWKVSKKGDTRRRRLYSHAHEVGSEINTPADLSAVASGLMMNGNELPEVTIRSFIEDDDNEGLPSLAPSKQVTAHGIPYSDLKDSDDIFQTFLKESGNITDPTLLSQFKQFENEFINDYLNAEGVNTLFKHAREICESYVRENIFADEFSTKLGQLINKLGS